ncbi:uncharacterized protein LOC116621113 [Nematostella vectensis]|uniref:uncharacterized protein LOC116621113 n=1 Tax=Nematostella vectensis TaxID=45351 RepID=UPI0020773858|nr:uncharacterized protein LOC116621113 [Nematostella vectensis]
MGRRKRKSNSEKRIEELYEKTLKDAKEGKSLYQTINVDTRQADGPCCNTAVEDVRKLRKRPEQILEEAIKKQQEQRKQRGTLSVPVSRLIPFRNDRRGLNFPQDFRRDESSLSWVPRRASLPSPCGISEYERLLWGEQSEQGLDTPASEPSDCEEFTVEDTLHVMPLRPSSSAEFEFPTSAAQSVSRLPPIYRRAEWAQTVHRARSRSIPARVESVAAEGGAETLVVGKQELFLRETHGKGMSLAETRTRIRKKINVSLSSEV